MLGKKNAPMKAAFCSGSCRLLTTISTGNFCLVPSNSLVKPYYGPGYLGHLYNIKQHIQFVKFIKGDLDLPAEHLPLFLNAYSGENKVAAGLFEPPEICEEKLERLRRTFMKQDVYIFEVCSLDIYEKGDLQVMHELVEGVEPRKQTADEFAADVATLLAELPADANVVFMGPVAAADADAQIIYGALNALAESSNKIKVFNPSLAIQKGGERAFKDNEFTVFGRALLFIMIYENSILKFN
jgi:hypothetical protein